jgi:eukaryotic-like serine/threonine-protein kinase
VPQDETLPGRTIPARVGRYEIDTLIGEGAMGRVFGARDTQLGRTVAVKLLPLAFAADQDMVRRFEQEARATAALNHPGIMAVYDAGVHEGTPYLVSELLEGTTLRTRLEAGRLPLVTALDFAVQIADALAAAHAHGVIHRDLKPENLFVCAGDRIKILDFGLAKLTQSEGVDRTRIGGVTTTLPKTVLGTPAYMPPEQARGEKADSRADIFSFGCILYEMLSGDRAFEGGTPADVISAILKDPPKTLDNTAERPLPPVLDAIVRRCLEKEPGARFQSASDLAFALRNISTLRGQPTEVAAPRRPRAWSSALTWSLAIPAAVVTIALIGMVKYGGGPAVKPPVTEFVVPPPTEDHGFAPLPLPGLLPTAPLVGLSPDGRSLAFVAEESTTGKRKLWIRSLDSSRPRAIEGTDDAASWPFWSPDNRYVVVSVGKALIKVDTLQQAVERFCTLPAEAPALPFVTGAWSADVILFSIGGKTGLYAVGVSGGTPRPVTTIDAKRGDQYHSWP